jgi:L-fuconolactonase
MRNGNWAASEHEDQDGERVFAITMRIDSHQHFWKYNPTRDTWITNAMSALKRDFLPEDLALECEKNGIDATIAVQAAQSEKETEFLLDLANRNPKIAGVVGWVDLCSPLVRERLSFFSQFEKLRGFRHIVQSEPDDRFLVRQEFMRGIARLQEFRFTYDILIYPKQLPAAMDLVAQFPEQRFVIDHMAKPEIKASNSASWAEQMRTVSKNPNVYCKLSGLVTEATWNNWRNEDFRLYLDVVFDAFGTRRLMFGSDWPVCLLAASYRQVQQILEDYLSGHSSEEKELIFGRNAIDFYGLKMSQHGFAA